MPLNPALSAHYRQLLGLNGPWRITDIDLDVSKQRVDIFIEWPAGKHVRCPECGASCGLKDHREERTWRHLDTMQFGTFLHCRLPRAECKVHGAKTVDAPWAEAGSRWTLMYEAFALLVLQEVPALAKASKILGISWDEAHAIRKRAVRRGLRRRKTAGIEYLGIDEKSFSRKERFITVLSDVSAGRILEVVPSKSTETAKTAIAVIPEGERGTIRAVAMDMAAPFENATAEMLPHADRVYDKFHIEQKLSEAMRKIQSKEHKALMQQGIGVFKRTQYLFLRRPERWSEKQERKYREIEREFGATKFSHSRIGRAWAIKEAFRQFWTYWTPGWACRFFRRWYFWATHCRMKPMIEAAKTIENHLSGILTYFDST
jgi:transposase